jgi:hypothetical protein
LTLAFILRREIPMLRHAVLAAVIAVCSGFNVAIRPAASHALASRAVAPTMLVEHLPAIDAASQLVAAQGLVLPIPAFSPAKVRARAREPSGSTDAPTLRIGLAGPHALARRQESQAPSWAGRGQTPRWPQRIIPSLAHEQAPINVADGVTVPAPLACRRRL